MTALLPIKAKLSTVPDHPDASPPPEEPLIDQFVRYRKAKGWTQPEAAERMQMSVNSLKAYERKSRTPNGPATLKILALMRALK